jgi:hypothetical protein
MAIRRGDCDYLLPTLLGNELLLDTWLIASDGRLTIERRIPPELWQAYLAAMAGEHAPLRTSPTERGVASTQRRAAVAVVTKKKG